MSSNMRSRLEGAAMSILRIVIGVVFVAHGAGKLMTGFSQVAEGFAGMGIPAPLPSAIAATLAELVAGAALALGLYTRLSTLPLVATMLVAMLLVHFPNGFFIYNKGYEYTLVLLTALLTIALAGPGPWAVDKFIQRRKKDDTSPTK